MLVVVHRGTVIDPVQLTITQLPLGGITAALAFAVFSFGGFESAATLAKKTHDPKSGSWLNLQPAHCGDLQPVAAAHAGLRRNGG